MIDQCLIITEQNSIEWLNHNLFIHSSIKELLQVWGILNKGSSKPCAGPHVSMSSTQVSKIKDCDCCIVDTKASINFARNLQTIFHALCV